MGLLATLVLPAASAGVESVSLTTVDSRQGIRLLVKLDRLEMSRGAVAAIEPERVALSGRRSTRPSPGAASAPPTTPAPRG